MSYNERLKEVVRHRLVRGVLVKRRHVVLRWIAIYVGATIHDVVVDAPIGHGFRAIRVTFVGG